MDGNLFNLEDLEKVLSELNATEYIEPEMTAEMQASQRRYEEYIKKNAEL